MMQESRKQFIEFAKKEGLSLQTGYSGYVNLNTQLTLRAWDLAWQASRAAIEIELPMRKAACASGYGEGYLVDNLMGDCLEYDETVESIRAIGLKIKGE